MNGRGSQKEKEKYFETDEYGKRRTCQNIQDAVKAILRGKFIVISTHIKKNESNLPLHFKELEKDNKLSPKSEKEGSNKD